MEEFKNHIAGALLGLAIVVGIFLIGAVIMAWLFYAVPWVYHHAPRLLSDTDFVPFIMAMATAFAGPAMVIGAITGIEK